MVDGAGIALSKGAPVIVRGLQKAAEYNGCKGVISGGPGENGRYEITLQPGRAEESGETPIEEFQADVVAEPQQQQQQQSKVLALKAENLQLDTDALREYVLQRRSQRRRSPALEDAALLWARGKGLSAKALVSRSTPVPELQQGQVLLRVDRFAFSQMAIGYLMKGYTRTFSSYHNFFPCSEDGMYRSGCWGYATVVESEHPKVAVGTRLYGLVPPCRYHLQTVGGTVPAGRNGEPPLVELTNEGVPFNLRRFLEYEVLDAPRGGGAEAGGQEVSGDASAYSELDDWRLATKESYTMAYYMDEQLLVETGMINCVVISCASCKTALALAYCLRMRDMRHVLALTSEEHTEFVRSTGLYHEVFTYEETGSLPSDRTLVYIDFRCDGVLRQTISQLMGTHLMYTMVVGPAVFQRKAEGQLFEKRAREVIFDESKWRERRKSVAEVVQTDRNVKLSHSYRAFVERMRERMRLRYWSGAESVTKMYGEVYGNTISPDEAQICSLHDEELAVEELWGS